MKHNGVIELLPDRMRLPSWGWHCTLADRGSCNQAPRFCKLHFYHKDSPKSCTRWCLEKKKWNATITEKFYKIRNSKERICLLSITREVDILSKNMQFLCKKSQFLTYINKRLKKKLFQMNILKSY